MPDYRTSANRRSIPPVQSIFSAFDRDTNIDLQLNVASSPERKRIIERSNTPQQAYAPAPRPESKAQHRIPILRGTSTRLAPPSPAGATPTKKSRTSSLFSLFSRPKVEIARGHHEATPLPARPKSPPTLSVPERPSTRLTTRSATPLPTVNENTRAPPIPERAPSRASVRSNSTVKSTKSRVARPRDNDIGSRQYAPWDPPPLFQAYPQAVKHMTLESSTPEDRIVRNVKDEFKPRTNRFSGFFGKSSKNEAANAALKVNTGPKRKIYVLVTTGHILQYAFDGPSDRLPERLLKLGRQSVAFASDLVPGKPFVLQVLQTAEDASKAEAGDKSFLSRFGGQSSAPKTVPSMLLIFEQPENMNEWMIALRREIEALGGRKFSCSTVRTPRVDNSDTISISSQRYRGLQRTMSMKSNMSNKAPSITSIPSMPLSLHIPSPVVPNDNNTSFGTANGSEWSSSVSGAGFSQRTSEGTNSTEQTSFDVPSPADDYPMPLLSKYNSANARREASPEFNMHDFLTPQPSPSVHPESDYISYEHQPVLMKGDVIDPQHTTPTPRPSSRTEAYPVRPKIAAQPTSLGRGYRGWSSNSSPRYPPVPPLPVAPTTPTIEVTRPLHIRRTSQASTLPGSPIAESPSELTSARQPPMTPIYRQKSSPTLPNALLATPSTESPITPGRRARLSSGVRNSSSPIPLRTSELYLSSPLQYSRSRSPSPLPSPGTPKITEQHPLRRPASLPVNSDPVPFLASIRPNGLVFPPSPANRNSPPNGLAVPMSNKQYQRASIQVPIIRPATIKNRSGDGTGLRSRKSAPLLSGIVLPPPGPPPNKALPAVPVA